MPRNLIHQTACELRLLQHGLLTDLDKLKRYRIGARRKKSKDEMDVDDDDDEDLDDLIDRREKFVTKCIRKSKVDKNDKLAQIRNPVAVELRREVIAKFLKDVALVKKCTRCGGITPSYRKDKSTKIFRKPLLERARQLMFVEGRKAPNPLLVISQEKAMMTNGERHGAEDEIAMKNALETQAAMKTAEIEESSETQQYLTPAEVHAALTLLFEREQDIVSLLFSPGPGRKQAVKADMFFITSVLVPPNKFRPVAPQGPGQVLEHSQNAALNKIIAAANNLYSMMREMKKAANADAEVTRPRTHAQLLAAGIALQEVVNALIDSPPVASGRQPEPGIKQELEKKEGLFRMHMMGKRVNYAARSVISLDPNIESNAGVT